MNESQTSNIPPELLDKIQKLLNLKEGTDVPAEAANASQKLNALLLKYNLQMSDVSSRLKDSKKINKQFYRGDFDLESRQGRHDANWIGSLVNTLCKFNLCICFQAKSKIMKYSQGRIVILGDRVNIEIVCYFADQLIPRILKACSANWEAHKHTVGEKRNTFRRGFLLGCVAGIYAKLEYEKQLREYKASNNPYGEEGKITALVKYNNEELEKFAKEKYKMDELAESKGGQTRKSEVSKMLGYNTGRYMEINKGLSNNDIAGQVEN